MSGYFLCLTLCRYPNPARLSCTQYNQTLPDTKLKTKNNEKLPFPNIFHNKGLTSNFEENCLSFCEHKTSLILYDVKSDETPKLLLQKNQGIRDG